MAVAWVQTVTAWGPAATPATSGSFTPTGGNFLAGVTADDATSTSTLTHNGSVNNLTLGASQNDAGNANNIGIFGKNSITGGSQTLSAGASGSGAVIGAAWEYSGVNTATYAASNPAGTASPAGSAVTVPTGAILLAFCRCDTAVGTALTAQANGGVTPTTRGSGTINTTYCAAEWAGNGGSITPTFSHATSQTWMLVQVLLTPPPAGPTINTQPTDEQAFEHQYAVFSVTATTSGGALSYQWQDDRTGSFANCPDGTGATSATYITPPLEVVQSGRHYQCIVTDSNGSTTTNTVTLTVVPFLKDSTLIIGKAHPGGMSFYLKSSEWW